MNADEIVKNLREWDELYLAETCVDVPMGCERFCKDKDCLVVQAADLIESLQAQISASQRRADAAVEDVNSVRMCHTCKHFLREFGMGGIECKMPCATIRHENFEWRGPQEAGEGGKDG